jgi:hypothetical protein
MQRTEEPPIIQYWNRQDVPDHIADCLATYEEHNPTMPHRVFHEQAAAELIAEHFGARHAEAFQACAVPAMQADYFRYCAVHTLGGVYADANSACTDSVQSCFLASEGQLFGTLPDGPVLNNVFAFRSPGHPLLALAVEIATTNIETRLSETVAVTTGPAIFSGLLVLHREGSLDPLRRLVGERRSFLDRCWAPFVNSFERAVERHGPLEKAFEGVRLSPRAEMLARIHKPEYRYQTAERHWAHWEGSIFR